MTFSPGDQNYLLIISIIGLVVSYLLFLSVRRLILGLASNKWRPIKAEVELVKIEAETKLLVCSSNNLFSRKIT